MPTKLSPILGLPIDDDDPVVVREPVAGPEDPSGMRLSVIVPARNEAQRLPACVASLLAQDDSTFVLGQDWELLLVDDASTDQTRALMRQTAAEHAAGVSVLEAPPLDRRQWTGKSHACWFAAERARGHWLLFTDADTLHESRDLSHALFEAEKHKVALLSYSPRQIVHGFAQKTLMPLVFSELASVYKMNEVNDPNTRIAAANGQFLMIERAVYFAVGGHKAIAKSVLEDVELAWNVKHSNHAIRFRYAPDALATRMYAGFGDMVEGWTKNLALLFPHALALAAWRLLDILLLLLPCVILLFPYLVLWQKAAIFLVWARTLLRFYRRVARSEFPAADCAISPLGLPLFVMLLARSWMAHHLLRRVEWKGREYETGQ